MMEPKIIRCTETKPAGTPPVFKEELYRNNCHDFNLVRVDADFTKGPHPYDAGDSFMLVLSGLLRLIVDGQTYELEAGELAWIPQGAVRGFTAGSEGAAFFAVHLRS